MGLKASHLRDYELSVAYTEICYPSCQARFVVLAAFKQMSTPLQSLEQQYAGEVVKMDAEEGLLKCLEHGIRGLKGVAETTGECSVRYLCRQC